MGTLRNSATSTVPVALPAAPSLRLDRFEHAAACSHKSFVNSATDLVIHFLHGGRRCVSNADLRFAISWGNRRLGREAVVALAGDGTRAVTA